MDLDSIIMKLNEFVVAVAISGSFGFLIGEIGGRYFSRKVDRYFDETAAERLGLEYERNIPRSVLREVQIERFCFSSISETLYNQDLLDKYLRKHPEKRAEWELKRKTWRAKYFGNYIDAGCSEVSDNLLVRSPTKS